MSNPEEKKCCNQCVDYILSADRYSEVCAWKECPCHKPSPSQSCEHDFECFNEDPEVYKCVKCGEYDKPTAVEPSVEKVMLWSLGIGDEFTLNGNSFKVTGFGKKRTANLGTVSIMKTISDGKEQYFMRDHEVVRNERNRHG